VLIKCDVVKAKAAVSRRRWNAANTKAGGSAVDVIWQPAGSWADWRQSNVRRGVKRLGKVNRDHTTAGRAATSVDVDWAGRVRAANRATAAATKWAIGAAGNWTASG